jgi:cell division protein FtsB
LIFIFRYELQQKGLLHAEDIGVVPDMYARNQELDNEVKFLKREVEKYRDAAMYVFVTLI